jgi:hypothetical protein
METERITLSQRDRDRLRVLHEVQQGHLTQRKASSRLQLSGRQLRRMLLPRGGVWRPGGGPRITETPIESQVR